MSFRDSKLYSRIWAEYNYIKLKIRPDTALAKEMGECLRLYGSNQENVKKLKKTLLYCRRYNKIKFKEYFIYGFDRLNDLGRAEYVGLLTIGKLFDKFKINDRHDIFYDKEISYETFKNYYGREIVKINSVKDKEKFDSFTSRHMRFMIKPIADHQGNGVRILENKDDLERLFRNICNSGAVVLEELIVQSEDMARFHPSSVNTVRFVTFYHNNVLNKILAVFRMGRNGNCVDNACAGGIFATIDMETGIINSPGMTHMMETFIKHPDTGVQILGAQIPRWKELNELVEKVVTVVPEQKQVGWDFALTDKGWIIVEGNDRPMMQQFVHNRGMRRELQCMFDAYYDE